MSEFQSTRSAWSATEVELKMIAYREISIHALRMERDSIPGGDFFDKKISIHALRMERDGGKYANA